MADKVVNSGSAKHISPFRYPGGKTWLVPRMIEWLDTIGPVDNFYETFAGGASVGLAVLAQARTERLVLVEKDPGVCAVWRALTQGSASELSQRVLGFDMRVEVVTELLSETPEGDVDLAFHTIVRNRAQRGGVMSPGAGLMKNGDGRGIASRWYPETLVRRFTAIEEMSDRIEVCEGDGTRVPLFAMDCDAVFIDPPYTASRRSAGHRLYRYGVVDHELLFRCASKSFGHVSLTYDDQPEVADLMEKFGMTGRHVTMQTGHNRVSNELFITKRDV